jgi:hypothetical protein
MRLSIQLVCLGLTLACQTAFAQCNVSTKLARNRDGSELRLVVKHCEGERQRVLTALYRHRSSEKYRNVLKLLQDADEAPTGGGTLRDLDGDGLYEVEVSGMCGAGPNCEGSIYRLTPDRARMFLFFSGGYAKLISLDNYLIESGRASCCSWEHRVYHLRSPLQQVQKSDVLYRIVVGIQVLTEADHEATCTFIDSENRVVLPSDQSLMHLCHIYGPDYVLAQPDPEPVQGR